MSETDEIVNRTKEWTLMFFFASDNALAPSIVSQLKALKQAGFHQQVNVVAQFDPQPAGTPTHIFDVNLINKLRNPDETVRIGFSEHDPKESFVSNLIEDKLWRGGTDQDGKPLKGETDRNGKLIRDQLRNFFAKSGEFSDTARAASTARRTSSRAPFVYEPPTPPPDRKPAPHNKGEAESAAAKARLGEADAGEAGGETVELNPKEALREFLKFCREHYPARRYILFILGHGVAVGNDIFLFDENADEPALALKDLGDLLAEFKGGLVEGTELELVSFHSCSVSSLEVAYELRGSSNYMLASQGPTFVGSWPYRQILIRVFKNIAAQDALKGRGAGAGEFRQNIKELIDDISDYCFHNSKDFLLAGYSFDVGQTNLNRVPELSQPLKELAGALSAGLEEPLVKNLIVLAHWESQSHWLENYTDIYDFCFCLGRKCTELEPMLDEDAGRKALESLRRVRKACEVVTGLLEDEKEPSAAGNGTQHNGAIARSRFAGPSYQYSHGLSVYFPWAQPIADVPIWRQYRDYKFQQETGWLDFLGQYFVETMRDPHRVEADRSRAARGLPAHMPSREEALNEDLASLVFNVEGQLSSETALALPAEKSSPNDRTGGDCSGSVIKNYPRDTRARLTRQQTAQQAPAQQRRAANKPQALVPLSEGAYLIDS